MDAGIHAGDAYDRKKTFAEGLLDVTILIANATQLKAVVSNGPSHKYYIPLLVLISLSIIIQLIVAVMLLVIGASEKNAQNNTWLNKMNNVTIGLILAITVTNIFISAFGIESTNWSYEPERPVRVFLFKDTEKSLTIDENFLI